MIKENYAITNNYKKKVNRVCDECGKEEETRLSCIWKGRRRLGKDIDLCAACSHTTKYRSRPAPTMNQHWNWKGGKNINLGYVRVYLGHQKRKYEHVLIYEKYLGRELSDKECIHHIDMSRSNNCVNNLYLCLNKKAHIECHITAEDLGYSVLNNKIWFDRNKSEYVLSEIKNEKLFVNMDEFKSATIHVNTGYSRRKCSRKPRSYLVYYFGKTGDGKNITKFVHTAVAEKILGRSLYRNENAHHIDGNTLNNDTSNLVVLSQRHHQQAHKSLEHCVGKLYSMGIVLFDNGRYFLNGS